MKYDFGLIKIKEQRLVKFRDKLKVKVESILDQDKFYVSDFPEIKFFDNRIYILDIRVKRKAWFEYYYETIAKIDEHGIVYYIYSICDVDGLSAIGSLYKEGFQVESYGIFND